MRVQSGADPWCLPRALISMVRDAWCAPMSSAARCRMLAGQYDRIREGTVRTRAGMTLYSPKTNSSPTTTARARRGSSSGGGGGGGGEAERCNAARTLHRAPWMQHAVQHATCNIQHNPPSQCNSHRSTYPASHRIASHRIADCASLTPARAAHRTARNGPARTEQRRHCRSARRMKHRMGMPCDGAHRR